MIPGISSICALVAKDFRLELRSKESITVLLGLGILETVLVAASVQIAFIPPSQVERLFPVFIWMVFVFSATLVSGRQLDRDLEHGALESILLTGAGGHFVYLSKVVVSFFLCFVCHLFTSCALAVLCGVSLLNWWPGFLGGSALVILGYSALSTLLTALTAGTKLKSFLLPLISLPLLFPLLFGALELTIQLQENGGVPLDSPWLSLLLGFDVVYLLLGTNLFESAVRET